MKNILPLEIQRSKPRQTGKTMKLKVIHIKEAGDIEKERVVLASDEDENSWNYGLGKATAIGDGFHPFINNMFLLPEIIVTKGDMISIYTKKGNYRKYLFNGKVMVHEVFIGLESPLWKEGDSAVLFNISGWSSKKLITGGK